MSIGPDITALLAGQGQEAVAPAPDGGDGLKRQILDLLRRAIQEDPDEEDKLAMEKCTSILQQLLARDQADSQQALGNSSLTRMLRKTG